MKTYASGLRHGLAGRRAITVATAAALLTVLLLAGCTPQPGASRRRNPIKRESVQSGDNLGLAMQFLGLSDDLDPTRARAQCAYHLNRWLEVQQTPGDWIGDPLFSRIPKSVRGDHSPQSLERMRFTIDDVRFIQQERWMRDVSKWVSRQPAPAYLKQWLDSKPEGLAADDFARLVVAERLFDWTVRNIQLEPLLEYPQGKAAGPPTGDPQDGGAGRVGANNLSPPARGQLGPGYTYRPWQVMLYGRGDAWQRARVFIQLCRQQHIDAVMLAIDDPALRPSPQPWIPAVVLGDQLFLFDTQLGMPIRGPDGQGIATLEQVRDDPALLESLDVGNKYKYAIRGPQLEHVVALIDAAAPALSQRMQVVEDALAGEDKLVLTVAPRRFVQRLSSVSGLQATHLWHLPFEVDLFRMALPRRTQESLEMAREYFRKELMYEGSHPLVAGRRQAFRGHFESNDDQIGAKSLYLEARLPDYVIDNLATDRQARLRVGIDGPLPENPDKRAALLANSETLLREGKLAASLWLGIAQFETDQHEDAIEWLGEKTLDLDTEGRWAGAARYNLARTYETLGKYDLAREVYYADQSPQAFGNRLRVRYFPAASQDDKANGAKTGSGKDR